MGIKNAKRIQKISPFHVMAVLECAQKLSAQGRDIIHMGIGEPDFTTPPTLAEAAIRHIATGQVKYTPAGGLPKLREKIAQFYQQRYGVTVSAQNIFITPGASGALMLALGVSINAGAELLMADPSYPCNRNFAHFFSVNPKAIPVHAKTGYQLNAELIRQNWTPATAGAIIASPSNPTGTLINANQLEQAIQTVQSLGGNFYSDEIYHGLVYEGTANTALEYSQNVFVINSFSKYFGMTGWRIGWLVVPTAYISATEKLAQNIFIATATPSQYAALSAFDDETIEELERRRKEFANRRDFLYHHLQNLGFIIEIKPEGAFYLYANCANLTHDSEQFVMDILYAEGVALTPGKDFGDHNPHQYVRFAYTQPIERMAIALSRIERFIKTR